MNARRRRRVCTYSLATANLLLVALIVHAAQTDNRAWQPAFAADRIEGTTHEPEIVRLEDPLEPPERYAIVIQRPLFDATRHPPAPAAAAAGNTADGNPAPPDYTLDGIIISGNRRAALLRNKTSAKTLHVTEGTQLGAWTLKALEEDRAVFGQRQSEHEIVLWNFAQPSAAEAAKNARMDSRQRTPNQTAQER